MEKTRKRIFKCSKCNEEFEDTIFQIVDTGSDPDAVSKLMDGTYFCHKCPKCGNTWYRNAPLLFNYTEHNTMIQYGEIDLSMFNRKKYLDNPYIKQFPLFADKIKQYCVTTLSQLLSCVLALKHGYDPRIAMLTVVNMANLYAKNVESKEKVIQFRYDNFKLEEDKDGALVITGFVKTKTGKKDFLLPYTDELHKAISDNFSDMLNKINPYVIDYPWVVKYMVNTEEQSGSLVDKNYEVYYCKDQDGEIAMAFLSKDLKIKPKIGERAIVRKMMDDGEENVVHVDIVDIETINALAFPRVAGKFV